MHFERRFGSGKTGNPARPFLYRDYTSLRMQYRNSLGDDDNPQNTGRRRQRRAAAQIKNELDQYLNEPPVSKNLYNGDFMA
jgi:hypothetical protein